MLRKILIAFALLSPLTADAADAIWFNDTPGQALYVRVRTSSSTAIAAAMSEGPLGFYYVTDAQLTSAGLTTTGKTRMPFKVFSGVGVSTSAADPMLATGELARQAGVTVDDATATWAESARVLTAGTNIVLAKGTGVTGFNDISVAQVDTAVDAIPTAAELATSQAAADDATLAAIAAIPAAPTAASIASATRTNFATELGRIDVATSTRSSQTSVNALPVQSYLDSRTLPAANYFDPAVDTVLAGSLSPADIAAIAAGVTVDEAAIATAVFQTPTSGLTTTGSIGKLLTDNVNATISSRASQTSQDAQPTLTQMNTGFSAVPTAAAIASATRTNFTTELGRIDVATSTRSSQTSVNALPTQTYLDGRTLASANYFDPFVDPVLAPALSSADIAAIAAAVEIDEAAVATAVFETAVAGLNTAGSIGKLFKDNLNATVSSRATQTSLDSRTLPSANYATMAAVSSITVDNAAIASAVRTNLTTELARIDVATSTRASTASIAALPNAATIASAVRTNLAIELGRIDATISSRIDSTALAARTLPQAQYFDPAVDPVIAGTLSPEDIALIGESIASQVDPFPLSGKGLTNFNTFYNNNNNLSTKTISNVTAPKNVTITVPNP